VDKIGPCGDNGSWELDKEKLQAIHGRKKKRVSFQKRTTHRHAQGASHGIDRGGAIFVRVNHHAGKAALSHERESRERKRKERKAHRNVAVDVTGGGSRRSKVKGEGRE